MIITNAVMTLFYVFLATVFDGTLIDVVAEKFSSIYKSKAFQAFRTIYIGLFEVELVLFALVGIGWVLYTGFIYVKVFL